MEKYMKKHDEANKFRDKPLEYYDRLVLLLDSRLATGSGATTWHDSSQGTKRNGPDLEESDVPTIQSQRPCRVRPKKESPLMESSKTIECALKKLDNLVQNPPRVQALRNLQQHFPWLSPQASTLLKMCFQNDGVPEGYLMIDQAGTKERLFWVRYQLTKMGHEVESEPTLSL